MTYNTLYSASFCVEKIEFKVGVMGNDARGFVTPFNLRLVIKGTGHDYLGRSNAADSLLISQAHS